MSNQEQGFEGFLKGWAAEFTRSVQTIEGQKPSVTWEVTSREPVDPATEWPEGFFWWQQPLQTDSSYTVWVGAPAASISGLTSRTAEISGDPKQSYIDLLNQSFEGAVHVLSWGRSQPIVCGEGTGQDHPPSLRLRIAKLKIGIRGRDLDPLLIGVDPEFDRMLDTSILPSRQTGEPDPGSVAPADEEDEELKPFFDRLVELELPVSIVLGRSVVPLRDVLKFTPGSLIELDRHVGEPAEIVVSNSVVARGEVVSVKGNYGIRVLEVISRSDRIALQAPVRKVAVPIQG